MKKFFRILISVTLVLVLCIPSTIQVFAKWPGEDAYNRNNYLDDGGTIYIGDSTLSKKRFDIYNIINIYLMPSNSDASSWVQTPTKIEFNTTPNVKNNTASLKLNQEYDFSKPVCYNVTAENGRTFPVFALAAKNSNGWSGWTEQDYKELMDMSELIANTYTKMYQIIDKIDTSEIAVGSYCPQNANMLRTLGWYLGMKTAYYTDNSTGQDGNRFFDSHANVWRKGGQEAVEFAKNYIKKHLENKETLYSATFGIKPATLKVIYEQIIPFYIDYAENTRISEPSINSYVLGGSSGRIDTENSKITVPLPKGTDLSSLSEPSIILNGDNKINKFAGSLANGVLAYEVTPYDIAYGEVYSKLSKTWTVNITEGDPDNIITSFAINLNGKKRYAKINNETKTISLNLPLGTDITALTPEIKHTGTTSNMDSGTFDFTSPQTLTLTNSYFPNISTVYTVIVTNQKSSECDINSYKIGDAIGDIVGTNITITVPYATNLSATTPIIELSEFAKITTSPTNLIIGENVYTVTSEDGTTKNYTVTIARIPAAKENRILSFSYGSAKGTINDITGNITLEVPVNTPISFAPTITLSNFATISPDPSIVQDFSNPIQYVVTSQSGALNTYTVTVTVSTAPVKNPYEEKMRALVNKIIKRYNSEAADDWEWMNLGFYQKKVDNLDDNYSIADCIAKLNINTNVAMTNIDRKIMTLTARGINCTNLAKYNNGKPFIDKAGNEVDNFVEVLYNYSGTWSINGPAFALIALDMGNYTIPNDAKWTREKLLETLLNHTYLSDGFGLDMVSMIMQSIAPYYNDPVYGERVKSKLDDGLVILMDSFGSKNSFNNPFGVQWGGVYTSEGSAQIVCALSAMGIDCYSDIRLNDGIHSALSAFLDYANYNDGYFDHTPAIAKNAMATYQGCYASQWYLEFLDNGGAGHPYSLYYHKFDFSSKLSTDASIIAFELDGKQGVINEASNENPQNTITITLPIDTPLTNMYPTLKLSSEATLVAPDLSQPIKFIKDVAQPFTVQAQDGKTRKTYYVTVNLSNDVTASGADIFTDTIKLEDGNILRSLDILSKKIIDNETSTDIELSVNAGVDTSNLLISAEISYGATTTPALNGKKKIDLTDWTIFTIISQDETITKTYRIKVIPKSQASISSFTLTIDGKIYDGVVDNDANIITVSGVDDSALNATNFVPDIVLGKETLVCSPAPGLLQDFAHKVQYIVSGGENVVSRTYTVSVLNKSGKLITSIGNTNKPDTPTVTGAKITGFKVLGAEGVIDHNAGTITVTLPFGTDLTNVIPVISLANGAISSPISGEVVNIANGIVYTVMNGTEKKEYTVYIILENSVSYQLWDKIAQNSTVVEHQVSYDKSILSLNNRGAN